MSEKITAMIEEIKALTVLELSELVKAIEEEFGVSAAAVAVAGPAAAAPDRQWSVHQDHFASPVPENLLWQRCWYPEYPAWTQTEKFQTPPESIPTLSE